ncbi:hypothetical protein [Henriciella marina]|uniref:hypothetical protein n=1 Tax=Henriciella marina TaxID=453851 RepID=UPI00036EAE1B|nr:hypothetical protein [Henriciella marina]
MIRGLILSTVLLAGPAGLFNEASAQEANNRSLLLAERNFLCTKTGSVTIDTGFTTEVTVDNTTNIYHGGNAKEIFVVDEPGGPGSVPEVAEAGDLRSYLAKTRRLSKTLPLISAGGGSVLAYKAWGPGPGGSVTVVHTHEDGSVTYRDRMDFGGGSGRFVASDHYGECVPIRSESELPETMAMKEGLSGDAAEKFIDEFEAEIDALAKQQQREESDNADMQQ